MSIRTAALLLASLAHASAFVVPAALRHATFAAARAPVQRQVLSTMQQQDNEPAADAMPPRPDPPPPPVYDPPPPPSEDKFIPIFVAVALGGYGLILVVDALLNGFCVPFVGACFGVQQASPGVWGS